MDEAWLTRDVAGLIGPRVPAGVVRTAVGLVVVAWVLGCAATEPDLPTTAEGLAEPAVLVTSVIQSLAIAGAVLVWPFPLAGTGLAAAALLALAGPGTTLSPGPARTSLVTGVLLLALALVQGVTQVRRTALARRAVAHTERLAPPALSAPAAGAARRVGRGRLVLAVLLLAAAAGSMVWWWFEAASASAFRARAVETLVRVESVADDWASVTVRIDGAERRVSTPGRTYAPGEKVTVRHVPDSLRAEITDDVADYSIVLALAVPCLVAAGAQLLRVRLLRARMHDLLTAPQPAVRTLAVPAPRADGALLMPVDDVTTVAAIAPQMLSTMAAAPGHHGAVGPMATGSVSGGPVPGGPVAGAPVPGGAVARPDGVPGEDDGAWDEDDEDWEDDAFVPGHATDGADAGHAGPTLRARPDISAMSDAELVALAREPGWESLLARPQPAPAPPRPVVVAGRLDRRGPVLVHDEGLTFVTLADVRHPVWRSVRPRTAPAREPEPVRRRFADLRDGALTRLARATGGWLPWVLLPGVAAASDWVVRETGGSVRLLGAAFAFATLPWVLVVRGTPALSLGPRRLRMSGALLSTWVPWGRVTGVAVDDDTLVVRYDNGRPGGDAILGRVGHPERALTADGATAAELALRIEAARAWATPGPRVVLVPSAALVASLAWLAAMLAPALAR